MRRADDVRPASAQNQTGEDRVTSRFPPHGELSCWLAVPVVHTCEGTGFIEEMVMFIFFFFMPYYATKSRARTLFGFFLASTDDDDEDGLVIH